MRVEIKCGGTAMAKQKADPTRPDWDKERAVRLPAGWVSSLGNPVYYCSELCFELRLVR